jgi:hypothetical protein
MPQTTNLTNQNNNQNKRAADNFKFDFKFFENLKKQILSQVIAYQDIRYAGVILTRIKPLFERHQNILQSRNPEFHQEWEDIFIKLEWIRLHTLPEKRILDLMENNFIVIYDIPYYDLPRKFKTRMFWKPLDERDDFKHQVQEALLRNNQVLTKEDIVAGTHEQDGRVGNWIGDYNDKLGTGPVDNVKFSNYIVNSQNTADLSEQSREKLKILLTFYEYLKYSSLSLAGAEENVAFVDARDHKLKILADGELIEAKPNKWLERAFELLGRGKSGKQGIEETKAESGRLEVIAKPRVEPRLKSGRSLPLKSGRNSMLTAYSQLPIPLAQIREKVVDLQKRVEINPKILEQVLDNPGKVRDKAYVVAALLLAAKRGDLVSLLDRDLVRRADQVTSADLDRDMVRRADQVTSADQVTTVQFIRDILEKNLGWSAEDSAKIGIRIGNILGGEHKGLAYYDKGEGVFRWV